MSKIQWTTETWNPVVGCTRVSAGCENCYAEQSAGRVKACGVEHYQDVVHSPDGVDEYRWTGEVVQAEHKLAEPLQWREPRRVFVDSMSDLFHPEVDREYIAAVFGVMAAASDHTFQILTKRPERMLEWFEWVGALDLPPEEECQCYADVWTGDDCDYWPTPRSWPLPNVWLGVSCENQGAADERIPPLLESPAAGHFVSAEPLLGSIEFTRIRNDEWGRYNPMRAPDLDWVIVGGESGGDAHPCRIDHVRSVVRQCQSAQVPVFVKQLGADPVENAPVSECWGPGDGEWRPDAESDCFALDLDDDKGGDPSEWPEDLRVREFPEGMGVQGE